MIESHGSLFSSKSRVAIMPNSACNKSFKQYPIFIQFLIGRYDEKGDMIHKPEDRMKENAWLSIGLYPGALLWFGWTVQ